MNLLRAFQKQILIKPLPFYLAASFLVLISVTYYSYVLQASALEQRFNNDTGEILYKITPQYLSDKVNIHDPYKYVFDDSIISYLNNQIENLKILIAYKKQTIINNSTKVNYFVSNLVSEGYCSSNVLPNVKIQLDNNTCNNKELIDSGIKEVLGVQDFIIFGVSDLSSFSANAKDISYILLKLNKKEYPLRVVEELFYTYLSKLHLYDVPISIKESYASIQKRAIQDSVFSQYENFFKIAFILSIGFSTFLFHHSIKRFDNLEYGIRKINGQSDGKAFRTLLHRQLLLLYTLIGVSFLFALTINYIIWADIPERIFYDLVTIMAIILIYLIYSFSQLRSKNIYYLINNR